jgi:predicted O-linked N-acetylglucosamine transferase (SPINDLY family)
MDVQTFFSQFDTIFKCWENKKNPIVMKEMYDMGIYILIRTDDVSVKEKILTRLLLLFPERIELYYYMGYIFKDTDFFKSLQWYNICIQKDPLYVESTIEWLKQLFKMNYTGIIEDWLEKNIHLIEKINDERIHIFLAAWGLKQNNMDIAETHLLNLLSKIEHREIIDPGIIFTVYCNYAFYCGKMSNNETSQYYLRKACFDIDVSEKNKKTAYSNYLLLLDYMYYDDKERQTVINKLQQYYNTNEIYLHHTNCLRIRSNRIKIGYVSSDFVEHAVSNFIYPILKYHNTEQFEVILYSQGMYQHEKHKTIDIRMLSTNEVAEQIYHDEIDILIDLNGYTVGNRFDVFSKRPSPCQISYIGYPNSLQLDFIPYRITDSIVDPEESVKEIKLRMPRCFLLFENTLSSNYTLHPTVLKEKNRKMVILGSMNKENKNTKETLLVWRKIMEEVPETQIIIKLCSFDYIEKRAAFYCSVLNVSRERIILIPKCTSEEYTGLFYEMDILLDPFPYSGTTTTCNALFHSVPVITHYHKDYPAHNVSASLLIHCGFPELVSYNMEEYIDKTVELCRNPWMIEKYKKEISGAFTKLMNPNVFINSYEKLLLETLKRNL